MSKESIIAFSQAKAEPLWLQDLRQAAFDKIESLALPKIERVKFHRWNLGDGTITENEPSANVPDFTALGNNPKLVITMLILIVQQSFMYQIMLKLTCQLKAIFTKMELQMFHLTNTF